MKAHNWFRLSIRSKVNNGNRAAFWHDEWISEEPLKDLVPSLILGALNSQMSEPEFINVEDTPLNCVAFLSRQRNEELQALRILLNQLALN